MTYAAYNTAAMQSFSAENRQSVLQSMLAKITTAFNNGMMTGAEWLAKRAEIESEMAELA